MSAGTNGLLTMAHAISGPAAGNETYITFPPDHPRSIARCLMEKHFGKREDLAKQAGSLRQVIAMYDAYSEMEADIAAALTEVQQARTLADAHSKNPPEAEHG